MLQGTFCIQVTFIYPSHADLNVDVYARTRARTQWSNLGVGGRGSAALGSWVHGRQNGCIVNILSEKGSSCMLSTDFKLLSQLKGNLISDRDFF